MNFSREQLLDFANSEVDQRERTSAGTGQFRVQIQIHCFEDRCDDLAGVGRAIRWNAADRVRLPNRSSSDHAATRERA
jgi:hypothetical protein